MSRLYILFFCIILGVALLSDASYPRDILFSGIALLLLISYAIYNKRKIKTIAGNNTSRAKSKQQRVYKAYWTQKTHIGRADEYECSYCGARYLDPWEICPSCEREMTKVKYDPNWVDEIETMDAMFGD